LSDEASQAEPKPLRKRIISIVIWVGLLVLVFGLLLPQIIDYGAVWDAIKRLTLPEIAVLTALGFCHMATEGLMYWTLLPELSLFRAARTWLIVSTGTMFLPPPSDAVAFYAVTRTEGVEQRRALRAEVRALAQRGYFFQRQALEDRRLFEKGR